MRANGRLVAANFGLLFFVVLLPFATEVLGGYRYLPDAYRFLDLLASRLGLVNFGDVVVRHDSSHSPGGAGLHPTALRIYRLRAAWLPLGFAIVLPRRPCRRRPTSRDRPSNWRAAGGAELGAALRRPAAHPPRVGPVPEVEAEEEAGEVDDDAAGELDALRDGPAGRLTMLERAVPQHGEHGPAHQLQRQRLRVRHHVARHALRRADPGPGVQRRARPSYLRGLINPDLAAYTLGFYVIALFWVLHHRMFTSIDRQDGTCGCSTSATSCCSPSSRSRPSCCPPSPTTSCRSSSTPLSAGLVSASLAVVFSYARPVADLVSDGSRPPRSPSAGSPCGSTSPASLPRVVVALIYVGGFQGWTVAWLLWFCSLVAAYAFLTRRPPTA